MKSIVQQVGVKFYVSWYALYVDSIGKANDEVILCYVDVMQSLPHSLQRFRYL